MAIIKSKSRKHSRQNKNSMKKHLKKTMKGGAKGQEHPHTKLTKPKNPKGFFHTKKVTLEVQKQYENNLAAYKTQKKIKKGKHTPVTTTWNIPFENIHTITKSGKKWSIPFEGKNLQEIYRVETPELYTHRNNKGTTWQIPLVEVRNSIASIKRKAAAKKTKKKGSVRLTPEEEYKLGEVTVNPAYVNMGKGEGVYKNLHSPSNRSIKNLGLSPKLTRSTSISSLNNVNRMFAQLKKNSSTHELPDSGVGSRSRSSMNNRSASILKSAKPGQVVYLPGSASSSSNSAYGSNVLEGKIPPPPLYAQILRKEHRTIKEQPYSNASRPNNLEALYENPQQLVGADYRTTNFLPIGADYRTQHTIPFGADYRVSSVNYNPLYESPQQPGNSTKLYELIPGQNQQRFLTETGEYIPPYIPTPTFT
jgi:hypothetical protein